MPENDLFSSQRNWLQSFQRIVHFERYEEFDQVWDALESATAGQVEHLQIIRDLYISSELECIKRNSGNIPFHNILSTFIKMFLINTQTEPKYC